MAEPPRMQEIKAEIQRLEDDGAALSCPPCYQAWDALYARKEALDADFRAQETRHCPACAEAQEAYDRKRTVLLAEWYALKAESDAAR